MGKNTKIQKYHLEEMILILLILATDLSNYDEDYLHDFAEAIEGRIDILFTSDFITTLEKYLKIDQDIINNFEKLRTLVMKLYSKEWSKKLKIPGQEIIEIRLLAKLILETLNLKYIEPVKYSEDHLNIDW